MGGSNLTLSRGVLVLIVGGVAMVAGGLLPWISFFGASGAQLGGTPLIVLVLGIACIVAAVGYAANRQKYQAAWIGGLVLSAIGLVLMLMKLNDLNQLSQFGIDIFSLLGIGFWIALVGPAVALVGSVLMRSELS